MKFKRPLIKIDTHDQSYTESGGYRIAAPTTLGGGTTIIQQTQLLDLVFSGPGVPGTLPLPEAMTGFTEAATVEQNLYGCAQVFVHVRIVNFGGAALNEIDFVIEFQDPDNPALWIPSKEPYLDASTETPRWTDGIGDNMWLLTGLGESYVLATRKLHPHFRKFRVRAVGGKVGVADGTTDIRVFWHPDSNISMVADQ
jgi:hypothetical protein